MDCDDPLKGFISLPIHEDHMDDEPCYYPDPMTVDSMGNPCSPMVPPFIWENSNPLVPKLVL